ncbi:MAG: 3-dehydroquinate synthase [Oligoflexia bacterium]|nr:3-dehydroquinate synthase [Oligoflexia bacterium]
MTKLFFNKISVIDKEVLKIKTDQLLVVIDQDLWSKYKSKLTFLTHKDDQKKIFIWKAPSGEQVKNLNDYNQCLEFFIEKGIHRKAHMIAIGGGATSDFAGFVASTMLRGINWSIIPTTLLSQVDAAIGGKVAVNTKKYKNLIGAFHTPENVYISEEFLETLPKDELASGYGEVAKYSFLDADACTSIVKKKPLIETVKKCAEYKLALTERDLKESGERKLLNLGHTFGHGIEKIYNIPHGVAVFWGMALIFKVFGFEKELGKLNEVRESLDCDFGEEPWLNRTFPVKKLMGHVSKDKKTTSNTKIDLVLPNNKDQIEIKSYSLEEIESKLESQKNELRKFKL